MLKKVLITAVLAGGLALGGFTVSHAEESAQSPHHEFQHHHHHFSKGNLEKFAKKLGIDPTGKTKKELKQAIKEKCKEKLTAKAKELGINPEGKNLHELKHAIHEKMLDDPAHLKKIATKLGIKTEGKTNQQIKQEVLDNIKAKRHARLVKMAQELGIATKGKTDQQLHDAIHQKWMERKANKKE